MNKNIAVFLAAAGLLVACSKAEPPPAAPEPKIEGASIVFPAGDKAPALASKPVAFSAPPNLRLNGRLAWDENRTVRVYSAFAGRVARILVQTGDAVRQGQALAVIASAEVGQLQAEARRAQTDLALSEKNLQRQKELEAHGVAPRKDLQTAEAEFDRARAEQERARARLKLYGASAGTVDQTVAISTPISGIVAERNINPGQEVRPDQMTSNGPPLFVVTNPDFLWVLLDASEKDLPAIGVGKMVIVRTPAYGVEGFPAKIVNISDFLDPATRTLKIRATLDNSKRRLKAEMFVTGEVETREAPRLHVPARAIYFQGGQNYVFTDDGNGRYTRRAVRIGDDHDGKVDILDGLQEGQRVVTDDVLMLQQMLQPRRVQK